MEFQYRGLKAKLEHHAVTEEEVNRQLLRLQQQTPRITEIKDRPSRKGDEVVLDYAGFCDGVQFAGGTAQGQTLVLGSGTFIPGFEDQLQDKVPGEEVTVKVTFPKQYHSAELAGKAAEFKCVIHQIRERSGYELDDTFAKEVGGCENLDQMRVKLRESMQEYADQRGEMDLQDTLLRQAAATLEMEISKEELEASVNQQMENMTAQLTRQGLSMDMYCQFMGKTREELRQELYPEAEQQIRMQATVQKVVELENLVATEEETAQALDGICLQNNMTMEQLQPYFDAEFAAMVERTILTGKVMELIRAAAVVEE